MRQLPAGIRVERAGPSDVARVTRLVQLGIDSYRDWAPRWRPPVASAQQRQRLQQNFASDDAWILMALEGDEIVGVVSLAMRTAADPDPPEPGTVYLWQMFVTPAWQGTGLAQALMDLAVKEAGERGYDRMTLWAAAGAKQACRFYEREGWTRTGEEQPDSGSALPLVQYERAVG
jgi:GNAT superfamily N-acetyltransferase